MRKLVVGLAVCGALGLIVPRPVRAVDIDSKATKITITGRIQPMRGRTDNPPREVLEAAAAIAARFSKAKHAGTVPVIWTRKRYVRKPRGSKPGLATCTHEKTVFVRPGIPEDATPE